VAAVLFGFGKNCARAAEPGSPINYAYATWVGTGYYNVADQQVYILRGNFSWTLRDYDEHNWGLELLLPATIGLYKFTEKNEDIGAVTFVPGLRLVYPVRGNWWLKPFAQLGFGKDFSGGDAVVIGGIGVKSLAVFPLDNGIELQLGNTLAYADNSDSGESNVDNGFSLLEIGLNSRWPINLTVLDRKTDLDVFFIYKRFLNELVFLNADLFEEKINRLYEIGVALTARKKFSILGIEFSGGGVDFTFGKGYFGIGLNMGFPF